MNNNIDFLNIKIILKYLIVFGIILVAGFFGNDIVALLVVCIILYYLISGKSYKTIEIWLIWFFVYGFYNSQGYIKIEFVSKYLAKPSFLLFCIFLANIRHIKNDINEDKVSISVVLLFIIILVSQIIHNQSPFAAITAISFFLLYFLLKFIKFEKHQYFKILNLFVANGLLQLLVSFLQLKQIIPPPSTILEDGSGGTYVWTAWLDDVACGTFGAISGYVVSWYESLISLLLLFVGIIIRKQIYFILSGICLLQFVTTDSKTIMVITIMMMVYLFIYYFVKHRKNFNLKISNIINIVFIFFITSIIMLILWNGYYQYYTKNTSNSDRDNINSVYKNYMEYSKDQVINNISDWGKIKGFTYIYNDFLKEGIVDLLFGYGIQGYNYNDKMSFIESKDTPLMQINNFTNSRSGLIKQFATTGLLGFIFFIFILIRWHKINTDKYSMNNNAVYIKNGLINVFSPFAIISAFIYSISFISITIICFGGLIGLIGNYSEYLKRNKDLK
jgi:hypothetical protein